MFYAYLGSSDTAEFDDVEGARRLSQYGFGSVF